MKLRLARLLGCAAWALAACSDAPTSIELRLYPCPLMGGLPTGVELEIRNRDAKGAEIGAPLTKQFPIDDGEAIFQDGYATVGYKPPLGTVTADITVTWTRDSESMSANYGVAVPGLGGSISLDAGECDDPNATGTGTTLEPTTGPDTSSSTGTSSSTTDTTTTTGPGTDTDPDTSTSTSTTTGTTTESTTETSTGTTGEPPMEGADCEVHGTYYCTGAPGTLGKLLLCFQGTWIVPDLCTVDACANLGLTNPQVAGCLGQGTKWACACASNPPDPCDEDDAACGEDVGDGLLVTVCDGGLLYAAACAICDDSDGLPLCISEI